MAVAQAHSANVGLWRSCQPFGTAVTVTAAPTTRATMARATGGSRSKRRLPPLVLGSLRPDLVL